MGKTRGERKVTTLATWLLTGMGAAAGLTSAVTVLNQAPSTGPMAAYPWLTYVTATVLLAAGLSVGAGIGLMVKSKMQAVLPGRQGEER